jgi:hypothetical protein
MAMAAKMFLGDTKTQREIGILLLANTRNLSLQMLLTSTRKK